MSYNFGSKNETESVSWNGQKKYSYKYDEEGNLISVSGDHSSYSYSYDLIGRLTSFFGKGNHSGGIKYDDKNRVSSTVSLVDNKGFVTEYTYNDKGLLTVVKSSAANHLGKTSGGMEFSKTNTYDALGRLANSVFNTSSPLTVSYTYLAGASTGTTTTLVASVNIGGKVLSYTYDEDGNITEIKENGTLKESYSYDDLGQMVRENNLDNNQTILYTYDGSGNILSKKIYPYTVGAVSGTPETITYSYGNSSWKDLLTAYNGETITYDEIGNPLTYRSGMTFGWEGGRKLTSFSTPNAVGNYVYNADGIRVYKEVNGNKTEYYLNGTEIETEITNFGGITRRVDYIYDENGSIYGFVVDNTAKYYYTKNLQGDVIGILDSTGTTIVEYSYDAWGKATVSYPNNENLTEAQKQARYLLGSNNPFRYRGYYFDNETGFYYLNSRYYDPETGRFINGDAQLNTDSILGLNLFAYCYNNPILLSDSTGNRPVVGAHPQKETEKEKEQSFKYMRDLIKKKNFRLDWPIKDNKGDITCKYDGYPDHWGMDIGVNVGTPIVASRKGKVYATGKLSYGLGNFIVIDYGEYRVAYGHLDSISVKPGQSVERGEVVGLSGNTGRSTGPHLHIGIIEIDDYHGISLEHTPMSSWIDPSTIFRRR